MVCALGRRLAVPAILIAALMLPAAAQEAAPPPQPSPGVSATRALIEVLKDEAARAQLIDKLEASVAAKGPTAAADAVAPPSAAATKPAPPRPRIGDHVVERVPALAGGLVKSLRQDWNAMRATYRRLGGLARIDGAELRALVPALGPLIAATLLTASLGRAAMMPVFRRLGHAAVGSGLVRKAGLAAAGILIDGAIIIVAALAGAVAMSMRPADEATRAYQLAYLAAFAASGYLIVAIRAVFSPATSDLRPLPMTDATARSWTRYLSVVVVLVAFGEILVAPLVTGLASPITARATLVAVYVVVIAYLVVLVVSKRKAPAVYFRQRAAEEEDDVALAVLASVIPYWQFVAVPYLLFLGHQAMTTGRSGLPILVGTAKLAAAFAVGVLVVQLLNRLAERGVSLSAGINRAFPTMEARLNGFAPGFLLLLRWVVLALWLGYALQAVGAVRIDDWLEGRFGIDAIATAASLILVVLAGFAAWLFLSSWIDHRLTPHGEHVATAREQTLLGLARNAGLVVILLLGLTYGLSAIGLSVAPLLASAGVVGLAIGFGSQKLVQDIINGLFIQFENAINVGDVVEVGGKIGSVEKLTIRSVSLRDVEGVFHVVPFSSVDAVSNHMKGFSFHVADIGIAYREDIDAAKAEMLAAYDDLAADMAWGTKLVGGIEWFGVQALADSAVVLRARLKTRPGEQWAVGRAYTEMVKKRLDAAGISIPFPQMTLWFGQGRDGSAPPARLLEVGGTRTAARRPKAKAPAVPARQDRDSTAPTDATTGDDYGEDE